MNEKGFVILGTLGTILLGVFASLIAWLVGSDKLQENGKEIVRQMFNWEVSILIISLIVCWIPVIGAILCMVMNVANLVFAIKAFLAYQNNKEFKAPSFINIK